MTNARNRAAWPTSVLNCAHCGVAAGTARYGGRGLCSTCYQKAWLNKRLSDYKLVARQATTKQVNYSRAKEREERLGDLYFCVVHIGASVTAQYVNVPVSQISELWYSTQELPDVLREPTRKLRTNIQHRLEAAKKRSRQLMANK